MPVTFSQFKKLYRDTLLHDVLPFWAKYSIDLKNGAINNCLDDDGNLVSEDKYMWSQGRALWTFSALYNNFEKNSAFLRRADGIFNYLKDHGRDETGKWNFRLDSDGNVLDRDISIYADGFVFIGMCEYFKATNNKEAKKIAEETYENTLNRLNTPGSYFIAPYEIPKGMKTHGINMIYSYFYYMGGKALGRKDMCDTGLKFAYEIFDLFLNKETSVVHEFVNEDGTFTNDIPLGRVCVPGHVIEGMWFLLSIFEDINDYESIQKACNIIMLHIQLAEDNQYGGLSLAFDVMGKPCAWNKYDCKAWWVHCEALVATAYAYLLTDNPWFMHKHLEIKEYAYSHFPYPAGEWTQWLTREGERTSTAALPVKDPFHLPRALMMLIKLFERLEEKEKN